MSTTRQFRSVLIRFAAVAGVMLLAAGCPSSRQQSKDSDTESTAATNGEQPQPNAEAPPNEPPGELPDGPPEQHDPPPAELPPLPGRHGEPFDPIEENGPIFEGWPKPKLALVITGRQKGYIEPCGCAGLDRMKGGMSRRHALLKQLRQEKGWPVLAIDVGGLAKGYGRQAEIKFQIMVNGMRTMGFDAVALGKAELQLPPDVLVAEALSDEGQQSPFLSANVGLLAPPGELTAQTRILEAGGMKIAVTGVLGKQYQQEINNRDVMMVDAQAALAKLVPQLNEQADYLVLLAHATMEETLELAGKFPDFDLVVTAGGPAEPPSESQWINDGKTQLIEVGEKGMNAVVLAMFDDPQHPFRYQLVPLDSRFPGSRDMQALMKAYQGQLEVLGLEQLGIPLGDKAPPHPQREVNGKFVGSKECESCHEGSYDAWKKTPHAKAFNTLVEADPPRQFDPECISCHAVGWHSTEHFPYGSGFQSVGGAPGPDGKPRLKATPHLTGVGCESCHGPGAAHCAAEQANDPVLQEKLRQGLIITKAEAQDFRSGKQHCRVCHDGDNSPEFDFEVYWPHVEHHDE